MLNEVNLIGNLGSDPEIKVMQSGDKVANFTVATTERWKNRETGEKQEKTQWHRVVVWSQGLVGVIETYLKKGQKVAIRKPASNGFYNVSYKNKSGYVHGVCFK